MPQPTSPIANIARLVRYVALSKTRQSVAAALFALALRYAYTQRRKARKLIHDLGAAGSPPGSDQMFEYDVIVVGGGGCSPIFAVFVELTYLQVPLAVSWLHGCLRILRFGFYF
jgi:hypothetical protein